MSTKKSKVQEQPAPVIKKTEVAASIGKAFTQPDYRVKPDENTWNDVENIFQATANGIYEIASNVNGLLVTVKEKYPEFEDNEVNIAVKGLSKDLMAFTDDVVKIHERHEGKTGEFKDADEHAISLDIFGNYVELTERLKAVTFNPIIIISEKIADYELSHQPVQSVEQTEEEKENVEQS